MGAIFSRVGRVQGLALTTADRASRLLLNTFSISRCKWKASLTGVVAARQVTCDFWATIHLGEFCWKKTAIPVKGCISIIQLFSFEDFLYKKPVPEVMVTKPPLRFWAQLQSIPNEHHPWGDKEPKSRPSPGSFPCQIYVWEPEEGSREARGPRRASRLPSEGRPFAPPRHRLPALRRGRRVPPQGPGSRGPAVTWQAKSGEATWPRRWGKRRSSVAVPPALRDPQEPTRPCVPARGEAARPPGSPPPPPPPSSLGCYAAAAAARFCEVSLRGPGGSGVLQGGGCPEPAVEGRARRGGRLFGWNESRFCVGRRGSCGGSHGCPVRRVGLAVPPPEPWVILEVALGVGNHA